MADIDFTRIKLKEFKKALKECKDSVGRKSQLPILNCVKITLNNQEKTITANNLENYKEVPVEADIVEDIDVCIMFQPLYDLLNTFTSEYIDLVITGYSQLHLGSENDCNMTMLKGFSSEDFPPKEWV